MRRFLLILLLICAVVMAACDNNGDSDDDSGSDSDGAVSGIENYLQALVERDEDAVIQYSCAAREGDAAAEILSLASIQNLRLEGMTCSTSGENEQGAIVTCEGTITGDYGVGSDDVNLDLRTYQMVREDGEWKMCGFTEDPNASGEDEDEG